MAGNLHSISVRILRRHAELVDLRPDFTILDTDDQIRLLKQIIQAENIDEKDGRRADGRSHRPLEKPRLGTRRRADSESGFLPMGWAARFTRNINNG